MILFNHDFKVTHNDNAKLYVTPWEEFISFLYFQGSHFDFVFTQENSFQPRSFGKINPGEFISTQEFYVSLHERILDASDKCQMESTIGVRHFIQASDIFSPPDSTKFSSNKWASNNYSFLFYHHTIHKSNGLSCNKELLSKTLLSCNY